MEAARPSHQIDLTDIWELGKETWLSLIEFQVGWLGIMPMDRTIAGWSFRFVSRISSGPVTTMHEAIP